MESVAGTDLDGVITSRSSGSRVFVLSAQAWSQIEKQLFNTFSTGASAFLVHLGEYYGRAIVRETKAQPGEPEGFERVLHNLAMASGWGELSVKGLTGADTAFTVEIRNCVFCSQASQLRSCYFLLGVVAGAAGETFGRRFEAAEHQCGHTGSQVCRMTVEPAESRDRAGLIPAVSRAFG
jgi:predicted hydrocarbon binding protein